jgi:hypothetical protein
MAAADKKMNLEENLILIIKKFKRAQIFHKQSQRQNLMYKRIKIVQQITIIFINNSFYKREL